MGPGQLCPGQVVNHDHEAFDEVFKDEEPVELLVGEEPGQDVGDWRIALLQFRQGLCQVEDRSCCFKFFRCRGDRVLDRRF